MAVELLLQYGEPDKQDRLVPVATRYAFDMYWLPLAVSLGLRWVPMFDRGLPIGPQIVPDVVDELHRFIAAGAAVQTTSRSDSLAYADVVERARNLLQELQDAALVPGVEMDIG